MTPATADTAGLRNINTLCTWMSAIVMRFDTSTHSILDIMSLASAESATCEGQENLPAPHPVAGQSRSSLLCIFLNVLQPCASSLQRVSLTCAAPMHTGCSKGVS